MEKKTCQQFPIETFLATFFQEAGGAVWQVSRASFSQTNSSEGPFIKDVSNFFWFLILFPYGNTGWGVFKGYKIRKVFG